MMNNLDNKSIYEFDIGWVEYILFTNNKDFNIYLIYTFSK